MPKSESNLRAMYKSYESVLRKKDIVSKFGSAFADVKRFLQRSNDLFDATFYNFDQIHDGVEVLVNAVELSKIAELQNLGEPERSSNITTRPRKR